MPGLTALIQRAIQAEPKNAEARVFAEANLFLRRGQFQEAVDSTSRAKKELTGDSATVPQLARITFTQAEAQLRPRAGRCGFRLARRSHQADAGFAHRTHAGSPRVAGEG